MLLKTRRLAATVTELTERLCKLTAERDALAEQVHVLAESRGVLLGQVSALSEERNALTGQVNALTGERNALTGQVNALTGERNALTGQVNALIEECNALTGQVNVLTEECNLLADRVNVLTGEGSALTNERNALTGQVNALTGKLNILTGKLNILTEERTILGNRVEALMAERQRAAHVLPDGDAAVRAIRTCGPPRRRRAKFLIVSNMRSGSTWLETVLGALPDVATDYEIKWNIPYQPSIAHCVIDEESPSISQILDAMQTDAPVVGSKFVFDPIDLTRLEFFKFRAKIGPEVRIIHLFRNFRDIFLSWRRGVVHHLNKDNANMVSDRLKAAIVQADIDQLAEPAESRAVSPVECYEELKIYLQNDAWAALLGETGLPYLLVDCDQIAARIMEIVGFVGSEAPPEAVDHALSHPAVAKLPPIEAAHLVANMDELQRLFDQFEILRRHLIGVPAAAAEAAMPARPQA